MVDDFTEFEKAFLIFSVPLRKVYNYSIDRNVSLRYAILDEYSFGFNEVNDDLLTKVRNEIISVLNLKI
jgi:hypothetical protein